MDFKDNISIYNRKINKNKNKDKENEKIRVKMDLKIIYDV
jgi:hypothetical protein